VLQSQCPLWVPKRTSVGKANFWSQCSVRLEDCLRARARFDVQRDKGGGMVDDAIAAPRAVEREFVCSLSFRPPHILGAPDREDRDPPYHPCI
jgi:hypothetical protein